MRLTTLTLALVTAAALSGCAANPRVEGLEPAGPPPLRVWIGYPIGSSRVHPIFVNREAHVAMFEIIPGRGVTMVYPQTREDLGASASHYANLAVQPARMFYHSDPFGHASFRPRYYYAVASAAPLNLTRLRSSLGATRRVLGRMYASYRSYDVIDRLTELVVPMQADEDWATDLFVDWPVPAMPPTFVARRLIACANGHVIQVPRNYPYHGCPGDAQVSVATTSAEPPIKELPRDSLRRPRMPGDRQRPSELSDFGVEKRRRAEPGARPPRTGSVARRPTEGAVRHSSDRATAGSSGQTPRAQASEPAASSGSSTRSQTVERREPRAQPESGESGKRKPQ